jgi:hypothetical protein
VARPARGPGTGGTQPNARSEALKQVVAQPYCLLTQPPTIAGTVHAQVRLPRAGPAAAAIARGTPRARLSPPPPRGALVPAGRM